MSRLPEMPAWLSRLYALLFAVMPWTFEYSFGFWKMEIPAEPLIALAGLGLIGVALRSPDRLRIAFLENIVLKISVLWVAWLAVSAVFSSMPPVSVKYWIVEAGHWWVFALGIALFPEIWPRAIRYFAFSMAGVVVYTLIHHAFYDFRADQALLAPMPFFPENTLYAAVLAMTAFMAFPYTPRWLLMPLLVGLIFSFCRAALVSVVMAAFAGWFLHKPGQWRGLTIAGLALFVMGMVMTRQEKIREDVSIRERLNRYACAFRMVHDLPWAGFGPGTFQFQYIGYQRPEEMTRISATAAVTERTPHTYGRGGGAHSEYLQAMAESGWPGLAIWLALTLAVLWQGRAVFGDRNDRESRLPVLFALLALLVFFLHGLAHNTLHDGRIAALFWAGAVQIVSRRS